MGKRKQTEENSEALDLSECLTTEASEVDLSIETDFATYDDNFEISDDTAVDLETDNFNTEFTDEIDLGDFCDNFDNYEDSDENSADCLAYCAYEAIAELAKFGQTLTTDEQRNQLLDVMWVCIMSKCNQ